SPLLVDHRRRSTGRITVGVRPPVLSGSQHRGRGEVARKSRCQHDVSPGAGGGLCSGLSVTGWPASCCAHVTPDQADALYVVPGLTPGGHCERLPSPAPGVPVVTTATRPARRPKCGPLRLCPEAASR